VRITEEHIQRAYEEAKEFFLGHKSFGSAVDVLVTKFGMNQASARDYINNFQLFMAGREYHRTLSAYATRYYLDGILTDFGEDALKKALEAVSQHLEYYENLTGAPQSKIRATVKELSSKNTQSLEGYESKLADQVRKSLKENPDTRRARLAIAEKQPSKLAVTVTVFRRNPDVVAEVLLRASGICEACGKKAPFARAKDGSPYLEIHHKVQLSKGGDDTVANAMALCPNCHREKHFG
jgi:5-methylcytosine-specific restriction protein A